jgi:hypothetical protein
MIVNRTIKIVPVSNYITKKHAILNLNAFCFGAIPDIIIELVAYWSVPQAHKAGSHESGSVA